MKERSLQVRKGVERCSFHDEPVLIIGAKQREQLLATLRHTRYQAAVIRDGCLLLVQCTFRDGSTWWMLPGGGREEDEEETACVAREVLEECGVVVHVDRLLSDVAADPPDGTYARWRTYQCTIVGGEPAPGGGEGPNAELIATRWLPLEDSSWPDDIAADRFLYPQLLAVRAFFRD